jgi:hypothetical protein
MPPRRACADWPVIMCPAPGCLPLTATVRHDERVLHLANRHLDDTYDEVGRALRMLAGSDADYRQVRFMPDSYPDAEAFEAAVAIKPTVIFMHPQCESVITPDVVEDLRPLCDSKCVIVQWTGDQHYEPADEGQRWFVELGRVCDASLVVNTKHPGEYAELGVKHPGFLEVGIDETLWCPAAPTPDTPPIVCLANEYPQFDYATRNHAFASIAAAFPDRFAVYGTGWENQTAIPWRQYLRNEDVPGVYSAARASISSSIRSDLPRYTSNRLFYALGCGAVILVERFPDCEGLGLVDGHNCLLWRDEEELHDDLERILRTRPEDWLAMRAAARELGVASSWAVRMGELQCIIDVIRSDR